MKVAVVTGSSYGLGEAITRKLLDNNFKVYGVCRSEPKIKNDSFVWLKADLLDDKSFELISSSVEEKTIDLLVNNAGTAFEEPATSITNESFNRMFGLNFLAPILLAKALSNKIENGLIINISSNSDRFTDVNTGLYSASKAALNIFYDALVLENKSLKVFNLLPSYINTPLQHDLSDGLDDFDWSACMKPEDVAKIVPYLIDNQKRLPNSSRIIIINNKLIEDTIDPEKLYYYNVETNEFKKLK